MIRVATLASARLVPEAAVQGFDGMNGQAWTVENGRIKRRTMRFGHRTEDARLEVTASLPDTIAIVANPGPGIAEGRSARLMGGGKP